MLNKRNAIIIIAILLLGAAISVLIAHALKSSPNSPLPPSPISVSRAIDLDESVYLPVTIRQAPAVVVNAGFENGYGGNCVIWTCTDPTNCDEEHSDLQLYCNDEQDVPAGWTLETWDRYPCDCAPACTTEYIKRLPEIRLTNRWQYPERVHSGNYAVQGFSMFACVHYTLWQDIAILPGMSLQAGAFGQTWNEHIYTRICLDDVCSVWRSGPSYVEIITPETVYDTQKLRLTLEAWTLWPWENSDAWFDDVWLEVQ